MAEPVRYATVAPDLRPALRGLPMTIMNRALDPTGNSRFRLLVLLLAAVAVSATGCAGSRRVGGSTLREAVEEARPANRDRDDGDKRRDDDKTRRKVLHAGREVPEPVTVVVETSRRQPRHERRRESGPSEPLLVTFGLAAGRTGYEGRELEQSRSLALQVRGVVPETRGRLELGAAVGGTVLDVEPDLSRSLRDVAGLSLDLSARYAASQRPGFAGVYGLAGFEVGAMWWDYTVPILMEDGGRVHEVGGDWMGTYSPYAGMGLTLFRGEGIQLGANLVAGYKFFDQNTHEGLINDLFDPAPFARFQFDLSHTIR